MRYLVPLLALPLASAACDPPVSPSSSSTDGGPSTESPPNPSVSSSGADPASPSGTATDNLPIVPPPTVEEAKGFAKSNNAFALDLYEKIRATKGNVAFSPFSITAALTMTWAGARAETAAQMKKVLHAEGTAGEALSVAGKLVASLCDSRKKTVLRVANRLFGDKAFVFEQPYLDQVRAAFGATLESLDFVHAAEDSRDLINAWVASVTEDRIQDLIPRGGIVADTRLVLTNAIYFLGDWVMPFDEAATAPAAFHVDASQWKSVPTMHETESFQYASTDGVKLLEMPYQGGDLAMTLILPDSMDGLDAVERRLSTRTLGAWIAALRMQRVRVSLPKFEVNPPSSLSLRDHLEALGMPIAFDRSKADLTAIANPPRPEDRLAIGAVFHKAFVKLDEKGTEAAAATAAVLVAFGAVMMNPTPPPEFRADHPFLFLLRDKRSGVILFMGRVSDPSENEK